jgi:murein DD-endopeptidase MepM/ murein hydrolase activator NlpD
VVAGNNLLIDHGNGEYSSLGHLQQGSVLAKVGA